MEHDLSHWFERLSALHHSLIRKAVAAEGLQVIHYEILHYLSLSNRYSNTAQALTEYLGNTKGSISQSLKFLEEQRYVSRKPDAKDKRITRLHLTASGRACLQRMMASGTSMPELPRDAGKAVALMEEMLRSWQKQQDMKGFALCKTCRFHEELGDGTFRCKLTEEILQKPEGEQICREHEF